MSAQGKTYAFQRDMKTGLRDVSTWWMKLQKELIVFSKCVITFLHKNEVSKNENSLQVIFFVPKRRDKWNPEMLQLCLTHIDKSRCDQFHEWLWILYGCRKVSKTFPQTGLKITMEWSRQSPKYEDGCVEKIYRSPLRKERNINGGTLAYYFYADCKNDVSLLEFQKYFNSEKLDIS